MRSFLSVNQFLLCRIKNTEYRGFRVWLQRRNRKGLEADLKTQVVMMLESFSNECRKSKTKVIILANHKGHGEPIKARSTYIQPAESAGKRIRARRDWFCLTSDWMTNWCGFFKPIAHRNNNIRSSNGNPPYSQCHEHR